MKALTGIVVAAAGLAVVWFLASPLFIDRTVDEDLDFLLEDGGIDMQRVMSMPISRRQDMMQTIMEAAAGARDLSATEEMPSGSPEIVARGRFIDADSVHRGSGEAVLYALQDGSHVVRFEDFRTTNGPDLVVYLAKHPQPTRAADVVDNGYVSLGNLKGNVGSQNYAIPAGTDIAEYNSVVIWCELFGVLFSPAALTRSL